MDLADLRIKSGYWYLASSYSSYPAGIERAFEDVCVIAGKLLAFGVHVYCPIAHTHPIALHGRLDPFSHDTFLPLDEQVMEYAHGILVCLMPGWNLSYGVAHEARFFQERNRPRYGLTWPRVEVCQWIDIP